MGSNIDVVLAGKLSSSLRISKPLLSAKKANSLVAVSIRKTIVLMARQYVEGNCATALSLPQKGIRSRSVPR